MQKIIQSAIKRSSHFSKAVNWYAQQLKEDSAFQKQFLTLAQALSACSVKDKKNSQQVFFIAVGKSAHVAQLIVSMLISVGISARFIHPTEAFHGDLGIVGKKDLVVLISNNGSSQEVLQLLPSLQARYATLFAITSKEKSPLAKATSHALIIPDVSEMCPLAQAPITSTITTLALCQLLVAATIEIRHFSLEDYAKNHPGGAIGRRIFLKVDDLMHKGKNLPQIKPSESFQKIISTFTRFSKAGLLVVENKKFLGLITEKDLRKSMEKYKQDVFSLKASDIMNKNPTTIAPDLLAIDAMHMMANHTPPFNLLPIVDKKGQALGLIHIHDLISAGIAVAS